MIASLSTPLIDKRSHCGNKLFQAMLPQIRRQASIKLRHLRTEARDEALAEVVARAFCAWRRLVEQGRAEIARPTPLVKYAVRQVRAGRRIGGRQNSQDIMSPQAGRIHGFALERLDRREARDGAWKALLVEDRTAGPAETAAARLDLTAWLRTLSKRNRSVAKALSVGETTSAVAQQFGLSPGRISQLRDWLRRHWEQFQGDGQTIGAAA
jgi:hypothetical protein